MVFGLTGITSLVETTGDCVLVVLVDFRTATTAPADDSSEKRNPPKITENTFATYFRYNIEEDKKEKCKLRVKSRITESFSLKEVH